MEQFKDVNRRKSKHKEKLNIAMFGQKRIPSREGGVEIVVEELCSVKCLIPLIGVSNISNEGYMLTDTKVFRLSFNFIHQFTIA